MEEQGIDFQTLPIFSGVDREGAAQFVRQVGGYVQSFPKGERISYTHGDTPRIGIVLEGIVQVLLTDPYGNEVLAYELKDGALFGNVWAVVGTEVCSSMMLETRTSAAVLWLPYREVEKVYRE
ncbi:MAG: Crp/Fnr family transcriptional regulator, partial [Schwartzia sp.]|nr:Crp/Fnr family transcriptional regulator [Schwartzia sp. (in: firmicutes)]